MTSLNQAQIDELSTIASSGSSGARVAYYSKLASFGINYGNIALGVVLESEISGRTANAYFNLIAQKEGVEVSDYQWSSIGNKLMMLDILYRVNSGVEENGSMIYRDLDYEEIKDYHRIAFSTLGDTVPVGQGVSINAWTAYAPIEEFGLFTWELFTLESSLVRDAASAAVLSAMWISFFNSPDPAVFTWASTVTLASMQNALAPGSPAEFIDNISGSRILMGTHSGEDMTFTPSTGAYQRSIHMGLGGNDLFNISANNNTQDLYDGGEGADRFVVSSDGGDKIYGGAGTDTIDFTNFATGIFLSISGTGTYNTAPISFRSVENVIGTAQADTFVFSTIAQGTDLLSIDGGAGLDTIVLSGAAPADDSSLRSIDLMLGVMGDVLSITNIENVTGGVADDLIYGNALANRLLGEAGNDHIEGMDGNDIIGGGNGDDVIHGGHGNDTIWGDHGTSFGDDVIHGGAGKDVIYAGDGKDMLYGDEDNDNIYGDAGDDYIDGGAGSDNLHGNAGNDVIRGGSGTNRLYGEEGNDDLLGGNGMDTVNGGSDDDRLNGGGSHDYLIGGAGADVFCFGSGRDVAEDFTLGQDRLFRDGNFSVSYTQWDVGVRVLSSDQSSYILLNGIDLQDLLVYENNDLLWS